jgi:micrococcal nuclease
VKATKKIWVALLFVLLSPLPSWSWQGKVVEVLSGDTIVVSKDGKAMKVRLYGIDCPERGQPLFEWATNLTSSFVLKKTVEVTPIGSVLYDTTYALVRVDGKRDFVSTLLISYGMAWVSVKNCASEQCKEWKKLEELARTNRVGLWVQLDPVPPWEWQKQRLKQMLKQGTE